MTIGSRYWESVTSLCAFIEPLIALSYKEALGEFNGKHAAMMYLYNKSDMASNMHAHVRERVRINFRNLPWAHIIDEPGKSAFMLLINGNIIGIPIFLGIKFKKQGYGYRTSNIQTESVKHFNSQQIEYLDYLPHIQVALPLPDLKDKIKNPPKGNNVVAGYTPEPTWSGFKKCAFTFPFGGRKVKLISEITILEVEEAPAQKELDRKEEIPKTDRVRRRTQVAKEIKPRKFITAESRREEDTKVVQKKRKQNE
jgi:hypothetical protein